MRSQIGQITRCFLLLASWLALGCRDDAQVVANVGQWGPAQRYQTCIDFDDGQLAEAINAPALKQMPHGHLKSQDLELAWQMPTKQWPKLCPATQAFLQRALTLPQGDGPAAKQGMQFSHTGQVPLCIVTGYGGQVPDYFWTAIANHLRYAQHHGYHYWAFVDQQPHAHLLGANRTIPEEEQHRALIWEKLELLRRVLAKPQCAWALWVDADTMFTNLTMPLPQAVAHPAFVLPSQTDTQRDAQLPTASQAPYLILSAEQAVAHVPINAGVLLMRRHAWTMRFIEAILSLFPLYKTIDLQEQTAISNVVFGREEVGAFDLHAAGEQDLRSQVAILPQRHINAFYRPGFRKNAASSWMPGDFLLHVSGAEAHKRFAVMQTMAQAMQLNQQLVASLEQPATSQGLAEDWLAAASVAGLVAQAPRLLDLQPSWLAPPFLWSNGYADLILQSNRQVPSAYFHNQAASASGQIELPAVYPNAKGFVWLPIGQTDEGIRQIETFAQQLLPTLQEPITLITTDGQRAIPSQLQHDTVQTLLNSPKILRWYTEHYDGTIKHSKLKPIPVGPNLRAGESFSSTQWLQQLLTIRQQRLAVSERIPAILLDMNPLSEAEQTTIRQSLGNVDYIHYLAANLPRAIRWQQYSHYRFVWFPRVGQLDYSGIWEALLLGAVPILEHSGRDGLFTDLPVALLPKRDQVPALSWLAHWYAEHELIRAQFQPFHHLSRLYWLDGQ